MGFGDNLLFIRTVRNKTASDVYTATGISKQQYSNYEKKGQTPAGHQPES